MRRMNGVARPPTPKYGYAFFVEAYMFEDFLLDKEDDTLVNSLRHCREQAHRHAEECGAKVSGLKMNFNVDLERVDFLYIYEEEVEDE